MRLTQVQNQPIGGARDHGCWQLKARPSFLGGYPQRKPGEKEAENRAEVSPGRRNAKGDRKVNVKLPARPNPIAWHQSHQMLFGWELWAIYSELTDCRRGVSTAPKSEPSIQYVPAPRSSKCLCRSARMSSKRRRRRKKSLAGRRKVRWETAAGARPRGRQWRQQHGVDVPPRRCRRSSGGGKWIACRCSSPSSRRSGSKQPAVPKAAAAGDRRKR